VYDIGLKFQPLEALLLQGFKKWSNYSAWARQPISIHTGCNVPSYSKV